MKIFLKGTNVGTTHLQPGAVIRMYLAFYNVTSIIDFTSMLTTVCASIIILWLFPTESKISPVCIIRFILTTLNNAQHICKLVRVDNNGALENSTDVTNLLVDYFSIRMETNGGDT